MPEYLLKHTLFNYKRHWCWYFAVNFPKFFRTASLKNVFRNRTSLLFALFDHFKNGFRISNIHESLTGIKVKFTQDVSQPAFTCSKLTKEIQEQGVEYFKVNNKDTRTKPVLESLFNKVAGLYCTPCSSVSFVNFEKVNAGWVELILEQ